MKHPFTKRLFKIFGVAALSISTFFLFSNSKANSITDSSFREFDHKYLTSNVIPKDSSIFKVKISNFIDYSDYDISIWIEKNYAKNIIAPFNLASLLNENPNFPTLNLWLISSDGQNATLMKNKVKSMYISRISCTDILYIKNSKYHDLNTKFNFNIKDIFGDFIPEHNKFFVEYDYMPEIAIQLMAANITDEENYYELPNEYLEDLSIKSYELNNDTIIGNFISAMTLHSEHIQKNNELLLHNH